MTWKSDATTQNVVVTSGSDCLYVLEKSCLQTLGGWTEIQSYDGIGAAVTSGGAGAGGLGNAGAYVWLRDPGLRRSLVIIFSSEQNWIVQYYSNGGGVSNYPLVPTPPADAVNLVNLGAIGVAGQLFAIASPFAGICQCAVNNAPHGNVYPFWMHVRIAGVSRTSFFCDAVDEDSAPATDLDLAVFYCDDNPPSLAQLTNGGAFATAMMFQGWVHKDDATEEFGVFISTDSIDTWGNKYEPTNQTANPIDGSFKGKVIDIRRNFGAKPGIKGDLYFYQWKPSSAQVYGDIGNAGATADDRWMIFEDMMFPGWSLGAVMPV